MLLTAPPVRPEMGLGESVMAGSAMDKRVFNELRRIVYEHSGIALGDGKDALVAARVGKRMRRLGITAHKQYLQHLMADTDGGELVHLLNVISTNVTSFFREPSHFEFIGQTVARWLAQGQRRFRFWSAACSTGEEPYSLAMTLAEVVQSHDVDVRILATDISTTALQQCGDARYPAGKMDAVRDDWLRKYFVLVREHGHKYYRPKQCLQNGLVFRRLNLSQPPFPMQGPFDIILCRNVMIYFDSAVRRNLLAEIHRLLRPDGYLIVGLAESLTGMMGEFKLLRPSVYTRK
jgi:chemotaxis protein methyltransferase CheR